MRRHFLIFLLCSCTSATAQKFQSDALFSLLNRPVASSEVEQFRAEYGMSAYSTTSEWSSNKGIEYETKDGRISSVTIGAYEPAGVRKTYIGAMPLGLRWGMTKAEVKQLLGGDGEKYFYDRNQDVLLKYSTRMGAEILTSLYLFHKDYSKLASTDSLIARMKGLDLGNLPYLKTRRRQATVAKAASLSQPASPSASAAGGDVCSALRTILTAFDEEKFSSISDRSLPGAVRAYTSGSVYVVVLLTGQEANAEPSERAMEEWRGKIMTCLPHYEKGRNAKSANALLFGDGYTLTDFWFANGSLRLDIKQQACSNGKTDVVLRIGKKSSADSGNDDD